MEQLIDSDVFRQRPSDCVARAANGEVFIVCFYGRPVALLGLDVYAELADDTANLGSVMAARERPTGAGVRRLGRQRREILEIPDTIGITEIQRRLASILDEVGAGRPISIYSSGKYVGVFITPAEYYRLRKLSPVVAWFRPAGPGLANAGWGGCDG